MSVSGVVIFFEEIVASVGIISLIQYGVISAVAWYIAKQFLLDEYRNVPNLATVGVPKEIGGSVDPKENPMGKDCITCFSPATMKKLGTADVVSKEQVADICTRAREAQKKWAKTTFGERRRVLRTLLNYIVTHQQELVEISVKETGKTKVEAIFGEVFMTIEKVRWVLSNGETYLASEKRSPGFMLHKTAWLDYVPYGVIGIIIPWNFPVHNGLSHIVTALMSGNAAVVKVSEWAAWSREWLQGLTDALFTPPDTRRTSSSSSLDMARLELPSSRTRIRSCSLDLLKLERRSWKMPLIL